MRSERISMITFFSPLAPVPIRKSNPFQEDHALSRKARRVEKTAQFREK
jgi:hypothetical protein